VNLILADFRISKTVILTILEALNFLFFGNFTLENVKISQKNHKFKGAQIVKMSVLLASK